MHKYRFSSILLLLIILLLIFSSCKSGPEPINYGHDECEFCRMLITDEKYGSEMITDKGKIYKFDSIECLIGFALEKNAAGDQDQTMLVTDFSLPGNLTDARTAFYVRNNNFRSPMGLNVLAFDSELSRQKFVAENDGHLLNWIDLIELVKQRSM